MENGKIIVKSLKILSYNSIDAFKKIKFVRLVIGLYSYIDLFKLKEKYETGNFQFVKRGRS